MSKYTTVFTVCGAFSPDENVAKIVWRGAKITHIIGQISDDYKNGVWNGELELGGTGIEIAILKRLAAQSRDHLLCSFSTYI